MLPSVSENNSDEHCTSQLGPVTGGVDCGDDLRDALATINHRGVH
jgi:hypothetical protein